MIAEEKRIACILAIDVGTTNLKAAMLNSAGAVIESVSCKTPLKCRGVYAEGSAEDLYDTMAAAVKRLVKKFYRIKAICISSQMNGLIYTDSDMQPLGNVIYGIDTRGKEYLEQLYRLMPQSKIYEKTRCPSSEICWPGKILWLKNKMPGVIGRTKHFMGTKEYLIYRLTGQYAVDCASASTTQLYDQETGKWWPEMLELLEIEASFLPKVKRPYELAGMLSKENAADLGLEPALVLTGSGDGPAATMASGAVSPGNCCISLGTTAVLRYTADTCETPDKRFFSQHLYDGIYLQGVRMNESGKLADPYIQKTDGIEQTPEGNIFINKRFYPKAPSTDGGKMAAVLNGILFQMYEASYPIWKDNVLDSIWVTGGGAVNRRFVQRIANLFKAPAIVTEAGDIFAGLAALVWMYENETESLSDAVEKLSLKQEKLEPMEDVELRKQWELYKKLRSEKVGVGFG